MTYSVITVSRPQSCRVIRPETVFAHILPEYAPDQNAGSRGTKGAALHRVGNDRRPP